MFRIRHRTTSLLRPEIQTNSDVKGREIPRPFCYFSVRKIVTQFFAEGEHELGTSGGKTLMLTEERRILALRTCVLAGRLLIENGSNMERVNDTLDRIAKNAGLRKF